MPSWQIHKVPQSTNPDSLCIHSQDHLVDHLSNHPTSKILSSQPTFPHQDSSTRPMDRDQQENHRQRPHSGSSKNHDQMAVHSYRKILLEDFDSDQFENMGDRQKRILTLLASSRP